MPRFAYVIQHHPGAGLAQAWQLKLNDRLLSAFGSLAAALGSAKSLFDIDQRSGADPTVEVAMPYGRFRVNWLGDSPDAITLTNSPDELPHAANADDLAARVDGHEV